VSESRDIIKYEDVGELKSKAISMILSMNRPVSSTTTKLDGRIGGYVVNMRIPIHDLNKNSLMCCKCLADS
jgi:hypothetical protein